MIIIEEVLLKKSNRLLNEFLKLYPELNLWESNGVSHWHFVYLNNNPELCVYMAGYSDNAIPTQFRFKEAYLSLLNKKFSDLLLLLTYYGHMDTSELVSKINNPQNPLDEFTNILLGNISNGYIAYAHQFEHMYAALSGSTNKEAYLFRKDWNKKLPHCINKARSIMCNNGLSFLEYINKYSFFVEGPFFLTANFHKTKLLYDHI